MNKSLLFLKAKRKIVKLLKETIYFNYTYKPIGIYKTSRDYIDSTKHERAIYKEIYPNLISELLISSDLYHACSAYIKPDLKVKTTYLIVALPNGRIHTDNATSVAVITADNKLLADVSFSYYNGKTIPAEKNNIFRQKHFTKPEKYKGIVFTLLTGGSGIENYFHWLIDVLPRFHLLKESGLLNKVDYFLIPAYKHEFQKQSLQILGIRPEKIIAGDEHTHLEADLLIASSAPRGNASIIPYWLCSFLRQTFLQKHLLAKHSTGLIYISRSDSRYRVVVNEHDLIALLEKYGFKTYVLSQFSFMDQISLFASAQVVIAPHGAGLINLVFCKRRTKVVEIFAGGYVKASYHDLSRKIDLDYNYLVCKRSPRVRSVKKGMKLNIFIDLDEIKEILHKIMPNVSLSSS